MLSRLRKVLCCRTELVRADLAAGRVRLLVVDPACLHDLAGKSCLLVSFVIESSSKSANFCIVYRSLAFVDFDHMLIE
ncbi:hypothetical protein [Chitinimonas naiadis]